MTAPIKACLHWQAGIMASSVQPVLLTVLPGRVSLATSQAPVFDVPADQVRAKASRGGPLVLHVGPEKYKLSSVAPTNVPPLPDELVQHVVDAYSAASQDPQVAPMLPPLKALAGSDVELRATITLPGHLSQTGAIVRGYRDQRETGKALAEVLRQAGAAVG